MHRQDKTVQMWDAMVTVGSSILQRGGPGIYENAVE